MSLPSAIPRAIASKNRVDDLFEVGDAVADAFAHLGHGFLGNYTVEMQHQCSCERYKSEPKFHLPL